mmetsp:Transcript_27867/g.42469  ORF Transcript_27867/g.42469 Transcript_27867/m.42469 type:complete len:310 (-) Transcript_27867:375-1304(-)
MSKYTKHLLDYRMPMRFCVTPGRSTMLHERRRRRNVVVRIIMLMLPPRHTIVPQHHHHRERIKIGTTPILPRGKRDTTGLTIPSIIHQKPTLLGHTRHVTKRKIQILVPTSGVVNRINLTNILHLRRNKTVKVNTIRISIVSLTIHLLLRRDKTVSVKKVQMVSILKQRPVSDRPRAVPTTLTTKRLIRRRKQTSRITHNTKAAQIETEIKKKSPKRRRRVLLASPPMAHSARDAYNKVNIAGNMKSRIRGKATRRRTTAPSHPLLVLLGKVLAFGVLLPMENLVRDVSKKVGIAGNTNGKMNSVILQK